MNSGCNLDWMVVWCYASSTHEQSRCLSFGKRLGIAHVYKIHHCTSAWACEPSSCLIAAAIEHLVLYQCDIMLRTIFYGSLYVSSDHLIGQRRLSKYCKRESVRYCEQEYAFLVSCFRTKEAKRWLRSNCFPLAFCVLRCIMRAALL